MIDGKKRSTRKLSREILGLLAVTFIISAVIFWLLFVCGTAVIEMICNAKGIVLTNEQWVEADDWLYHICLILSVIFFAVLLMFLMGERIAETLKKIEDKERALSQEKEQLIRSLSHDIRTPLTSIMSYSEFLLLEGERTPEEYRQYLELIRKKGLQIKELTDVLLDGGKRNLQLFEDGRFLMEQLAGEFEEMLEDEYDIKLDLTGCKKFKGSFDINELQRIFDNLISNIQKYADPTEAVVLKIETDKGNLVITQRNKILQEPKDVESNKIGLASIKRIVHNYGGKMETASEEEIFEIIVTLSEF